MGRLIRGVYESEGFKSEKAKISSVYQIDKALESVVYAVGNNAEMYPIIPGMNRTRMASTRDFVQMDRTLPALRVYYAIEDKDTVELLWVEELD